VHILFGLSVVQLLDENHTKGMIRGDATR